MKIAHNGSPKPINSPRQVLFASLIGTAIEYFDFYIYGMAAVLVFPRLFFPKADPATATLAALATFGIAFVARPIGASIFGHFGDRVGRKTTLVLALSTMGFSTFAIGVLPTYASWGIFAPLLLSICRFGQGIGLGGEWGGAILLAVENAPPNKRAWYGMFPQLGAPLGFFLCGGIFFVLSRVLTDAQFIAWGWRLPFVASAALVLLGLYVRLTLTETPVFQKTLDQQEQVKMPMLTVFRNHAKPLALSVMTCLSMFVLFYLMTVFTLSWATGHLGYTRDKFLLMQLFCVLFFALTIPISALLAEKGRRRVMIVGSVLVVLFGLAMGPLFMAGTAGAVATMSIGLGLMGIIYGPLGTVVSEFFPTPVRYTGSSLAFSFAGILGASLAPSIATSLATNHGLSWVGYYLATASLLTLIGLLFSRETKNNDLTADVL